MSLLQSEFFDLTFNGKVVKVTPSRYYFDGEIKLVVSYHWYGKPYNIKIIANFINDNLHGYYYIFDSFEKSIYQTYYNNGQIQNVSFRVNFCANFVRLYSDIYRDNLRVEHHVYDLFLNKKLLYQIYPLLRPEPTNWKNKAYFLTHLPSEFRDIEGFVVDYLSSYLFEYHHINHNSDEPMTYSFWSWNPNEEIIDDERTYLIKSDGSITKVRGSMDPVTAIYSEYKVICTIGDNPVIMDLD